MVNEETSERLSLDVVEATPSPSLAQSKNSGEQVKVFSGGVLTE